MFCFHKYGKIENGYQYCTKCNKAIKAPCNHKWREIDRHSLQRVMDNTIAGMAFFLKCENCGEIIKKQLEY